MNGKLLVLPNEWQREILKQYFSFLLFKATFEQQEKSTLMISNRLDLLGNKTLTISDALNKI